MKTPRYEAIKNAMDEVIRLIHADPTLHNSSLADQIDDIAFQISKLYIEERLSEVEESQDE